MSAQGAAKTIAGGGVGFYTKVKVSFLKPEKVNIFGIPEEKMKARSQSLV